MLDLPLSVPQGYPLLWWWWLRVTLPCCLISCLLNVLARAVGSAINCFVVEAAAILIAQFVQADLYSLHLLVGSLDPSGRLGSNPSCEILSLGLCCFYSQQRSEAQQQEHGASNCHCASRAVGCTLNMKQFMCEARMKGYGLTGSQERMVHGQITVRFKA